MMMRRKYNKTEIRIRFFDDLASAAWLQFQTKIRGKLLYRFSNSQNSSLKISPGKKLCSLRDEPG